MMICVLLYSSVKVNLPVLCNNPLLPRGWGNLYLKLDIILVKKMHVIRVVFQDQVMYMHMLFMVQRHVNFEKFNKTKKNTYFESIFMWKICAQGVFVKYFYEDDVQPEIQVPPPPRLLPSQLGQALPVLNYDQTDHNTKPMEYWFKHGLMHLCRIMIC